MKTATQIRLLRCVGICNLKTNLPNKWCTHYSQNHCQTHNEIQWTQAQHSWWMQKNEIKRKNEKKIECKEKKKLNKKKHRPQNEAKIKNARACANKQFTVCMHFHSFSLSLFSTLMMLKSFISVFWVDGNGIVNSIFSQLMMHIAFANELCATPRTLPLPIATQCSHLVGNQNWKKCSRCVHQHHLNGWMNVVCRCRRRRLCRHADEK